MVIAAETEAQERIYPSVGICIYCGSDTYAHGSDRKLGDEHIVPEGLGGRLILKEASCKACETITSQAELEWLRGSFYAARVHKGFGKKKKRTPLFLPLKVLTNGEVVTKTVPLEEYPPMVVTLLFDTPEILLDLDPVDKVLSGGVAIGILPSFGELLKDYLAQGSVTIEPPRKKRHQHTTWSNARKNSTCLRGCRTWHQRIQCRATTYYSRKRYSAPYILCWRFTRNFSSSFLSLQHISLEFTINKWDDVL